MRLAGWGVLFLSFGVFAQGQGDDGNNDDGNSSSSSSNSSSLSYSSTTATPTNPRNISNPNATQPASASAAGAVVTTTITSPVAGPSGTQTATFVLTLTLDHTGQPNATEINSTMSNSNTTDNTTQPWNDTLSYLPFTPHLDAAFGVGGALLLITGIPVATLGGKNRWSALAMVSGYSVGLFTLVIILSFGVSPALEPPSPHPPTAAMRGLYLLAVGISFIIGSAIGIFWYNFAKYWVGAAGGFALGWFIVCLKKGGLLTSVGGRWALIAGLTALGLLCSLIPKLHDYVLLVASAWIGATLFTLGVDCFTRAGLKEFYIYNLGYQSLFPSLNGGKYPLTQSMQVELGVIAAAALIAGAIQFKVIAILKKRRKEITEEEEARIEAQQIAIAAENFKNVDAELIEWEGKHGDGTTNPPILDFDNTPSTRTLVGAPASPGKRVVFPGSPDTREPQRLSLLEEMGYVDEPRTPISSSAAGDPDLEQKMQLLADVRRARESINSSLNQLRSTTNTPTMDRAASVNSRPGTSLSVTANRVSSPANSGTARSRHESMGSNKILDRGRYDSGSSAGRRLDEPPSHIPESERLLNDERRASSHASSHLLSMDDSLRLDRNRRNSLGPRTFTANDSPSFPVSRPLSSGSGSNPSKTHTRSISLEHPPTEWERKHAEHEEYVQQRTIVSPDLRQSADFTPKSEDYAVVSGAVARRLSESTLPNKTPPTPGQEYGTHLARVMSNEPPPTQGVKDRPSPSRRVSDRPRVMSAEDFSRRHRESLTRMQDRVSGPMKAEIAVAAARDEWNSRTKAEREEQRRKEEQKKLPRSQRGDTGKDSGGLTDRAPPKSSERQKRTEEWRLSLSNAPISPGGGVTATAPAATAATANPRRVSASRRPELSREEVLMKRKGPRRGSENAT